MSFAEQERVLFELLFDPVLREQFAQDMDTTLARYILDDKEKADFKTIRPQALILDANMRAGLLLSSISHSYPVSFSIVSSLNQGLDLLKPLINIQTMQAPPAQRASMFGAQLRDSISKHPLDKESERSFIIAIVEAELGMAWTAATLKQHVIEHGKPDECNQEITEDWPRQPVKLADFVSVAMLPNSYAKLKQQLCPKTDRDIYTQLSKKPLPAARRSKVLQQQDPRLIIAKAQVVHASQCEPAIEHQTLELSEGFAHLFQHINGNNSIEQLLTAFKQAGAPDSLLESVRKGFKQLIENNMLIIN